jgi:hypothetical protein
VIQIEKFAHTVAASAGEFLDHHTSVPTAKFGGVGGKHLTNFAIGRTLANL